MVCTAVGLTVVVVVVVGFFVVVVGLAVVAVVVVVVSSAEVVVVVSSVVVVVVVVDTSCGRELSEEAGVCPQEVNRAKTNGTRIKYSRILFKWLPPHL